MGSQRVRHDWATFTSLTSLKIQQLKILDHKSKIPEVKQTNLDVPNSRIKTQVEYVSKHKDLFIETVHYEEEKSKFKDMNRSTSARLLAAPKGSPTKEKWVIKQKLSEVIFGRSLKNKQDTRKRKIAETSPFLSVIIFNVNGLNSTIRTHRDWQNE